MVSKLPQATTANMAVDPYGNKTGWSLNTNTGNYYQPGTPQDPTVVQQQANQQASQTSINSLYSQYSWLKTLGIDFATLQSWVADDPNLIGIVEKVRGTSQWSAMFPGIRRADGTLTMSEGQYLSQQDSYRALLSQYGYGKQSADWTPSDTAAFFQNNIDPNELKQRLTTYDEINRSSDDVKAAFYVYAGMHVSTDDLYQATVDPSHAAALSDQYNQTVAKSPLDYDTWITRATEFGLESVTNKLSALKGQGIDTGTAISQIQSSDPQFARQMMDALYHGYNQGGPFLNLSQLMASFDYAMIGGAATAQGLALPDQAFVQELRQAGVSRADALAGFGQVAQNLQSVRSALGRANRGGDFSATDYEQAVFLHDAKDSTLLDQAASGEKALGETSGSAPLSYQNGKLVQRGLASV